MESTAELKKRLNEVIFVNPDYNALNKTIEEIHFIEGESITELEKMKSRTIYLWLFVSYNLGKLPDVNIDLFIKNYEEVFSSKYDKLIGIKAIKKNHLRVDSICTFPDKFLKEAIKIVNSLKKPESIIFSESQIKRLLFSEDYRLFFTAVMDERIISKESLQDLFQLIKDYIKSEIHTKRSIYGNIKKLVEDQLLLTKACHSFYCISLMIPFYEKINYIIGDDFKGSYAGKPAAIKVSRTDKKYPFFLRGKNITLEFLISNNGEGPALDFKFRLNKPSDGVEISETDFFLGTIEKGSVLHKVVLFNSVKNENIELSGECSWLNLDESYVDNEFKVKFLVQKENIDWSGLSKRNPFNLEPVTSQDKLVGRLDILNKLNRNIQSGSLESFFILGQKRTGKTSIVRTFETVINNTSNDASVIYIDGGEISYPGVKEIISAFGEVICESLIHRFKQLKNLDIPKFDGALAPIDKFFKRVDEIIPNKKVIFIIDEFDEFPIRLYKGAEANSFFQTIRSISSKQNFAFLLVGGEKMEIIKRHQGYRLNKFKVESVTYFDKETHYDDFKQLLRKPIVKYIDISDEAISLIYEYTSGNPYFTKLIAIDLYELMTNRKDSSITTDEVIESVNKTLDSVASNSFHHFWMDGILEDEEASESQFDDRRKFLLAFIEAKRSNDPTKENILKIADSSYYVKRIISENLLREFERREVIFRNDKIYSCKVKLFEKWLINNGLHEIITSSTTTDSILRSKLIDEEDYVKSQEVVDLISRWGLYRGIQLTEDSVRNWLSQFGDSTEQRLAFNILKGVNFYSYSRIREYLRASLSVVSRELKSNKKERFIKEGEKLRRDILVSYLDEQGKSGSHYAKQFADENGIFQKNICDSSKIFKNLVEKDSRINAIVLIDDIIGTGKTMIENLTELTKNSALVEYINTNEILVIIVALCGFSESKEKILSKIIEINNLKISICDPLGNESRAFHKESQVFSQEGERLKAYDLAKKYGERLEKAHPLGYGGSEGLIVFDQTCPNNSLPILWKEKSNWIPLFKRV